MIINLLSSPRNVSTAFMYSFAQRADTQVYDEPFYAYYLSQFDQNKHPGQKEILESMSTDFDHVLYQIESASPTSDHTFLKNMTHHFFDRSLDFMSEWRNIIFIRNPKEIIHSFSKVIPNPGMRDIGIKMQLEVFEKLSKTNSFKPIILDSHDLLLSPESTLKVLCAGLNITFDSSMLQWPKGPRKEDGIWAKYWYKSVHQSTGFDKPSDKEITLSPALQRLAEESKDYYQELSKHKLKINDATTI